MPYIRNTFTSGKMNKDKDERLLLPNEYRHAENIRVINSEGSDVGAIEKTLSNDRLTGLTFGNNPITLASLSDSFEDKIYWCVVSDSGSYVIEYDIVSETAVKVLEDERVGNLNQLRFNASNRIQMVLIIDSDNGNRFLAFTDNNEQPRFINIERAKTYGLDNFREEQILLIKKPPLYAPTISLNSTGNQENNIEEKFISIGYRYKYLDGEYSAISPQSEFAFFARTFKYRFTTGTNEGMLNQYNRAVITFNTGSDLVTDIELIYKESGSNNLYVIETFNKAEKGWSDDTDETFEFTNNKIYKLLPVDELFRIYDNVPLKALAIAVINNRIVFGNYTENYNLLDSELNTISPDFTLSEVQSAITEGTPTKSLKTNRDYEIARVYGDEYGRITTPLTSDTNTIYFPNSDTVNKNQIKVTIPGKPPSWATFYRFFIKESKQEYETIVPTLFFFNENFIYFYIQASDVDKVRKNDFLIVKADTEGILDDIVKIKVLEVSRQEKNFINNNNGGQPEGFYIKSSVLDTDVIFDPNSYSFYRFDSKDQTENSDRLFGEGIDYIESIFKGDTLDDITPATDYSYGEDRRYEIEILNVGTPDTFRWRSQEKDGTFSSWDDNGGVGYDITGALQTIDPYLDITFGATTGHSVNDKWLVKINNGFNALEEGYSWAYFAYPDTITIGSIITLKYYSKKEKSSDIDRFNLTFISSGNYENLEEWYFGDEIYTQIDAAPNFSQGLGFFTFRKVIIEETISIQDSNFTITIAPNTGTHTVLIIRSRRDSYNSSRDVYSDVYIEVRSLEQLPIFENEIESEDKDLDIFYEIGRTYLIDANGNHLGYDGSDVDQDTGIDAELVLPVFNCFSWGNGFESYKIRDEFNARTMKLDTRPSTPIDNYRQNVRIASFTFGGVFEQTTNYNALNEFNLSRLNFKDLDDKYGPIQKIVSWNNDLDVYQDDKVHKVYYDKSVIYDQEGNLDVTGTDKILDAVVPYAGEFGISTNPESLAVFGNYTYWTDWKRGVVLRKGRSGIEIISNFGMRDWFKDAFINGNNALILGGYDSYFGQYVLSINGFTLTFDEKVNGWTSFHSFLPDEMVRLNNRFYTIKLGQLWLHNIEGSTYLNFYDTAFTARVTTIFNQESQFDKRFKTIVQEALTAWSVILNTNYTQGTISASEFNQRESRWFAYIRQNESTADLRSLSQGIGNIQSIDTLNISFNQISESVSIGDFLCQSNGGNEEIIGTITEIDRTTDTITVDAIVNAPVLSRFAYGKKNARIEGSEIRGYYMQVKLEDSSNTSNELFAVSTNADRSFI